MFAHSLWHNINNKRYVTTNLSGAALLADAMLNKGCAFSHLERDRFGLTGLLPEHVESLAEQTARMYQQFGNQSSDLAKNRYLQSLHDSNKTLFYHLLSKHLAEMLPIMYTPTVGDAVENFSLHYNKPYGLYLSYPQRRHIKTLLANVSHTKSVALSVVTDGEGVMGIGDQGVGGMDIAIAKLMVYTACGGIPPYKTLPIFLDVGTNNESLLNNPMYLGWRHERVCGSAYDDFIADFVAAYQEIFANSLLHWEDLGRNNANRILQNYRTQLCTINGDIQATGVVALAAVLSAIKKSNIPLAEHRIIIFGAGSAGVGIANYLSDAMVAHGLTMDQARHKLWLIDKHGLLTTAYPCPLDFHRDYLRSPADLAGWCYKNDSNIVGLYDVVANVKPTILIGCSTVHGAFSEAIVRLMADNTIHPIIMPLSNPLSKSEAQPQDLLNWTQGRAIVATGSPYKAVHYNNQLRTVAQCNNALSFPGIGLGALAVQAKYLSDGMLSAAAHALADYASSNDLTVPVLPNIATSKKLRYNLALAVAQQARHEGLAGIADNLPIDSAINDFVWEPEYYPYNPAIL
jgi:malate dehydrogenase (oxaloacetate-decarboxylating)